MRSWEAVTPIGLLLMMSTLAWSGLVLPERLDSDVAASESLNTAWAVMKT